ncbi:putative serine/threonine-protein kinase [Morus notabilis]|uniref:Putative serine/threonine-protein kinase n=1 Tax=Morus notabilis TaxID=981085 RepID=W9RCH8_9ROSA|nr:putative serine/threonine-protein kinase [Morus notabilis]
MGCVQGKPGSPNQDLERQKAKNDYVKGRKGDSSVSLKQRAAGEVLKLEPEIKIRRVVFDEKETSNGGSEGSVGRSSKRVAKKKKKKIGGDELVGRWPDWLVENIPQGVLEGLVPRSVHSYDKLAKIGHGTYSNVYKARDRVTKKIVALKKVRFDTSESDSIKFMAREIRILQKLDHPNVIKLVGLATSRMQYSLYLVLDYMQADLAKVITRSEQKLDEAQVKCYMQQLFLGLQHCHERGILHRDIKASNLLVDKNGTLKIADFGLANFYPPKKGPLTSRVVTLWYRAPELLLGSTDYGIGIDLWSAGCILAEMFIGRPFMPGRTEVEQLHKIFKLCGAPPDEFWTKMKLPTSFRPPKNYKSSFEEVFRDFPSSSFGLLKQLLALDPAFRGTAASALESDFFSTSPLACELSDLPVVYTVEDEPTRGNEKKKRKSSKSKKSSRTDYEVHQQKDELDGQAIGDVEHFNEEKNAEQPNLHNQEMGNSASSSTTSSSSKHNIGHEDQIFNAYLSPVLSSHQKRFSITQAHPNSLRNINPDVLKNINNFTLLQASVTDIINHKEGSALAQYFRSLSALDFRNHDPEKSSEFSFVADNE